MGRIYTQNGYPLGEVISALQKDIRRGNEEQALYWCLEIVPRYERYLWRRLLVICNEDIGIANPEVIIQVAVLRNLYFEFRDNGKDGTCRLILANVVLLMCRSKKSRISDHMQRVVTQQWCDDKRDETMREIPDYALDKHTMRGHTKKRGFEHWLEVGCQLDNEVILFDPYKKRAIELWTSGRNDAPDWGKRNTGDQEQLKGKKSRSKRDSEQLSLFNKQ